MKHLKGIFYLLVMCCAMPTAAQVNELFPIIEREPVVIVDTLGRNYDTTTLEKKVFKSDFKEKYNGPEFNYNRVAKNSSANFFNRFISWLLETLSEIFGFTISPLLAEILTYLFYFIIGVIVVYIIIRFVGTEGFSKVLGKDAKNAATVNLEETNIQEIDLAAFIAESLAQGNYRNALRYQYLNILKTLSAKGLIEWDFQKTNADYYRELKNYETRNQFQKVSRIYDYVWYGEFPIAQNSYEEAMKQFNHLNETAA